MEMHLITLEVDGSFSNPIVVRAMAIWIAALLAVLLPTTVLVARKRTLRAPIAWGIGLAVLLVLPTHAARVLIGTLLYQRTTHPTVVSVGFWGGSAPLVVPLVVAIVCSVVYIVVSRTRHVAAA